MIPSWNIPGRNGNFTLEDQQVNESNEKRKWKR